MRRDIKPTIFPQPPRDGTTLTEVLMAILCMGIGVVAVASLFPIALLRSVQATQLTSGTILRFNAETLVDLDSNIYLNPDADAGPTGVSEHFSDQYLVDPLGAMIVRTDEGRTLNQTDMVGNMPRFDGMRIFYPTPSYGDAQAAQKEAEKIVTLPDSWVTMHEIIPRENESRSVTLEEPVPQDVIDTFNAFDENSDGTLMENETAGDLLRVVLFHSNGRISETRPLTDEMQIDGSDISWARDLPAAYDNNDVIRVRIEVRERRYTWLLSVRNFTTDPAVPRALVDVVVFFRRSPSIAEETPYALSGTGRTYIVNKINAGDPDPFLKKGGFMLDTDTGTWHRIQDVDESTNAVTLERNITNPLNGPAVFMRGVVKVYPLGPKP